MIAPNTLVPSSSAQGGNGLAPAEKKPPKKISRKANLNGISQGSTRDLDVGPNRKPPTRSKSDEGPSLISPSGPKKKGAVVGGEMPETKKSLSTSQRNLPSKARPNSTAPYTSISAAGQLDGSSRSAMMVRSKAASMMHVDSPTKQSERKLVLPRPPPTRTRSHDDPDHDRESPKKRQAPLRSKSGDLENLDASTVKDQRTGIPPRTRETLSRSILRTSTHGTGAGGGNNRQRQPSKARIMVQDNDLNDDSSIEVGSINFNDDEGKQETSKAPPTQRAPRPGMYSRPSLVSTRSGMTKSNKSLMDLSGHSFKSTLDLMSSKDYEELWPNDPIWKKACRYIRLLPPHPEERPDRRWIRIYTWTALLFDFVAALVSLLTYSGVAECCGVPMISLIFLNFNWKKVIQIVTYIYMVLIFVEVLPVVREGMPFNLLNPLVGFVITFAMFFDDSLIAAVLMWVIEAGSVFFEFRVFRLQSRLYHGGYDKLDELEKSLTSTRLLRASSHHRVSSVSSLDISVENDEEDDSGNSFGEDDDDDEDNEKVEEGRSEGMTKSISGNSSSSGTISKGSNPLNSSRSAIDISSASKGPGNFSSAASRGSTNLSRAKSSANMSRSRSTTSFQNASKGSSRNFNDSRSTHMMNSSKASSRNFNESRSTNMMNSSKASSRNFNDSRATKMMNASYSGSTMNLDTNHKYREAKLLRERRQLRLKQAEERKKLGYHLAGVIINLFLTGLSLILIVVIASSGGLCLRNDVKPKIFSMNQLGICDKCPGKIENGLCEQCDNFPEEYQCYFQY